MKILIVCVNYNSYGELRNYLQSVEKSALNVQGDLQLEVIIADNSTQKEIVDCDIYKQIRVKQVELPNLGYLGGAQAIINNIDKPTQYDYIIISNVDLLFEKETIKQLIDFKVGDNVAWVAPSVYSETFNKDLNPNVINRYKRWKLTLLKLTYNKFFYRLYTKYYYSNKGKNVKHPMMDIYAGHGSIIMLTSNFFKNYSKIDYPVFLYGEELYFAELIRRKRMRVVYTPSIVLNTIGGVSTSKMPSDSFFKYNKEAINYILENFY